MSRPTRFPGPAKRPAEIRLLPFVALLAPALIASGCGGNSDSPSGTSVEYSVYSTRVFDGVSDDLVTSGYGIARLKTESPTTSYADPESPTAAEIRRNLVMKTVSAVSGTWTNFYGPNIDPATELPTGNDGKVAGEEIIANIPLGKDDNGNVVQSSAVLQIPSTFSATSPCLMAVATGGTSHFWSEQTSAQWALLHGCAVVVNEKSTGPSIHDLSTDTIVHPDGTTGPMGDASAARFIAPLDAAAKASYLAATPNRIAFKWANSRWNPEQHAGEALLVSIQFARAELAKRTFAGSSVDSDKLMTIVFGQSGGGGAAIAAAEQDATGLITGVVVNAPQTQTRANPALKTVFDGVTASGTARTLDDYFSLSTLWQPCAYVALHPDTTNTVAINRCTALKAAGLVTSTTLAGQAAEAIATTRANGWVPDWDSTGYGDLYTYGLVSQYGHFGLEERLCHYSMAAVDGEGVPIALTAAQRAAMAVTYSGGKPSFGYSPTANVVLVNDADPRGPRTSASSISASTGLADGNFDGALCMRDLVTGASADAARVRAGVDSLLANGNLRGKPTVIIQGRSDTTLPVDFTVRPYVALNSAVEGATSQLSYIELVGQNHTVDALYSIRSLEAMRAHLLSASPLPPSQVVRPDPATNTWPRLLAAPAAVDRITASAGVLTIPK